MPTFSHGKSTIVLVNATDLSSTLRSASRSSSQETADTTAFGSTNKTYITGMGDGTISFEGMFEDSVGSINDILTASLASSTNNTVTCALTTPAVGSPVWLGSNMTTSYSVSSPLSDIVSVQADFQSNKGVKSGVSLNNYSAVSASANLTAVDGVASTSQGFLAALHVITNTRTSTTDIKIQDSADNVTFTDLSGGTFTQVASTITSHETLFSSTGLSTVRRYVRGVVTLGAGSGSVTFLLSVARHT